MVDARAELPVGPLFCILDGPTRGRPWSGAAVRTEFRRVAALAGCRVGRVRHRYSRKGRRGTVIRQRPKPAAVLPNNSPVNFVVSRGRRS